MKKLTLTLCLFLSCIQIFCSTHAKYAIKIATLKDLSFKALKPTIQEALTTKTQKDLKLIATIIRHAPIEFNAMIGNCDAWQEGAFKNDQETIRFLIDAGIDVNQQDQYGRTPLINAAWQHAPQVAQLLINLGADVNLTCKNGDAPLHAAARSSNSKVPLIAAAWKNSSQVPQPLIDAAWKNSSQVTPLLIDAGADVNLQCNNGNTPLHIAACRNNLKTTEILLNAGAKRNIKNRAKQTARETARECPNNVENWTTSHQEHASWIASDGRGAKTTQSIFDKADATRIQSVFDKADKPYARKIQKLYREHANRKKIRKEQEQELDRISYLNYDLA